MATTSSATPTPITPPRVAVLDPRTGLISREWYLFFLSLFRAAEGSADADTSGPTTVSLVASLDAAIDRVQQETQTLPVSVLEQVQPLLDALALQIDTLPRAELGTLAAKNTVSLTTDVSGVLPTANGGTGESTPTGIRFTNLTTTQKNAISSPATGLVIFDTTLGELCVYAGANWQTITPTPRVNSQTSVSTLVWDSASYDQYVITALATSLTINADSNSAPVDGQKMTFRFKDSGTARALTWTVAGTNSFRVIGTTLPTTTVANKLVYVGCIYNAASSLWDVVAVGQEV